ncbi:MULTISPECIES: hypothetical protein [unclassified Streptomyces]|uniref:hypothetical protein n=1 Tax=unclassified Streptomyces TaxID=2593676 RepID=UPI002E811A73|nr:hypothetical protein [Streptomyces sp. NBC_00589]WTI39188.1 hypothetical protein OIC96_31560 [Streptomyces sp. NBC_00775]WUB27133.1 hypothetical protein OHA51_18170 [Streptomyces sp. NBC_00589]
MAEYEGVDALLAAITDEPLPEGAHEDAEFMAEHRSAAADLTLLREQLALIGDALADGAETTEAAPSRKGRRTGKSRGTRKPRNRCPAAAPKQRSRHPGALAVTVGTLVTAVVALMVVGMGWLIVQGGAGGASDSAKASGADAKDGAGASLSAPGYLACSRLVVEGTVAEIEPLPGADQDRITLDVTRSYKPAQGKAQVTFLFDEGVGPRPHKGQQVLVAIRHDAVVPDKWVTGKKDIAAERRWIVDALPQSRGLHCEE